VALAGCGDRRLDLALVLARDSCAITVPAGGSLLYQVTTDGTSFCGGCVAVPSSISGADAIVGLLRQSAPPCIGVHPATTLRVALTAWNVPMCPDPATTQPLFCSISPPVPLPDGREDALVSVVLTCNPACTSGCVAASCTTLNKNCGMVSDGCTKMLDCGGCSPPDQCGGRNGDGIPNVCSK
jgi:hypothetical protein